MLYVFYVNDVLNTIRYEAYKTKSDYLAARAKNSGYTPICVIDTNKPPIGETYREKKNTLHEQAVNYSHYCACIQSVWELCDISAYFEKYGKKYGLLLEFRENAII